MNDARNVIASGTKQDKINALFEILAVSLQKQHGFNPEIVLRELRLMDKYRNYCRFRDTGTHSEVMLNTRTKDAILQPMNGKYWQDDEMDFYRQSTAEYEAEVAI